MKKMEKERFFDLFKRELHISKTSEVYMDASKPQLNNILLNVKKIIRS